VAHTCNLSTRKDKSKESQVQGQHGLHRKFEDNLSYIMGACQEEGERKREQTFHLSSKGTHRLKVER
jgi:hypothetical protein